MERPVNSDAEKILLTFVVFSKSVRKKCFFNKIFGPIRIREKIKFNYSTFCSFESRNEWTVMLKNFYWPLLYSRNGWEKIFLLKIFGPIRFREKIKFNSFSFSSLVSTDEWTLMLKIFYSLLFDPRNRWQKEFFLLKIFGPIRFRENMKFNLVTFCSLESRDQWTLMLKKSYWLLFDVRNRWEKKFFSWKFSDQSDFEKKSNSINRSFAH